MTKRALVKWLHWLSFALMMYFMIVEPEVGDAEGAARTAGLATHAGMGMILAAITLIWSLIYFSAGPLGRPGPKLPAWGKRAHRIVNTGLYWLLPGAVVSGGLAGLASEYPVLGFGVVPLNPTGWGSVWLHDIAEEIHEIAFDLALWMVFAHLGFHLWRHFWLKDNALRIMVPKPLHRWL